MKAWTYFPPTSTFLQSGMSSFSTLYAISFPFFANQGLRLAARAAGTDVRPRSSCVIPYYQNRIAASFKSYAKEMNLFVSPIMVTSLSTIKVLQYYFAVATNRRFAFHSLF